MVLRHHLNLSEPQRTPNPRGDDDGLVNSSTRLDVVVPQAPCVRDVRPIVSGRCRAALRARRATMFSQRSRCPSTRSSLVRALQPRCVATIPHSQRHFTAPPPLISPCTASRAFNGEGRLTLGAWTTRRAPRGGQRCPPAQTSSDRLSCDHSSTAHDTCVPSGSPQALSLIHI